MSEFMKPSTCTPPQRYVELFNSQFYSLRFYIYCIIIHRSFIYERGIVNGDVTATMKGFLSHIALVLRRRVNPSPVLLIFHISCESVYHNSNLRVLATSPWPNKCYNSANTKCSIGCVLKILYNNDIT